MAGAEIAVTVKPKDLLRLRWNIIEERISERQKIYNKVSQLMDKFINCSL